MKGKKRKASNGAWWFAAFVLSAVLALSLTIHLGATAIIKASETEDRQPEKAATVTAPTCAEPGFSLIPIAHAAEVSCGPSPDEADVEMLARLIWGEARGVGSETEKAAVVWCVLNRVDETGYGFGESVAHVVTFPYQFDGYRDYYPATEENKAIARDVLGRWYREAAGETDVGRVLPKGYLWFIGDGDRNYFTNEWNGGDTWDWSLPSPYDT